MKLLISIVPKHIHDEVIKIISESSLDFQVTIPGKGTAPKEILEYLCLGETEREVIMSVVDSKDIETIFDRLKEDLDFLHSGRGVAFTVSIDALTKLGYKYLHQQLTEELPNG